MYHFLMSCRVHSSILLLENSYYGWYWRCAAACGILEGRPLRDRAYESLVTQN